MKKSLMLFDYAIKTVLREKANFGVLSGFLSELLNKQVVVQEILEGESNKKDENSKTNRLDLKAKIDNGEIAVFEIQVSAQIDFFQRMLFGVSKAVVEQLYKNDPYEKIKKVYSIDIVYFELGKGSDYIYRGFTEFKGVHNDETLLFSESEEKYLSPKKAGESFPEYYLIYPHRFDETIRNRFDEWVYVLKNSELRENFSAAGVLEAGEALDEMKMSIYDRALYEQYLKDERIRESSFKSAEAKGLAKGLAKGEKIGEARGRAEGRAEGEKIGEKQKAIEIAKRLKSIGIPSTQISQATGLTTEKIENL